MRIGLRGVAGCGKTTVAKILSERTGWPVVSMAEPLRQALLALGITKEGNPELYRRLMQDIGAACRKADPLFFVRLFEKEHADTPDLICDDLRYPNEAGLFDRVFYLEARGWTPKGRGMTPDRERHESETWNMMLPDDRIFNHDGRAPDAADFILEKIGFRGQKHVCHRIYVAGPYSADNAHDTAANVRRAVELAEACWAKGHEAFCPHSHSHAVAMRSTYNNRPIGWDRWMEHSVGIIDNWATALLFLGRSPGADREAQRAVERGLTMFTSIDEVPDVSQRSQQRGSVDGQEAGSEEEGAQEGDAAGDAARAQGAGVVEVGAGGGDAGRAHGSDCDCVSR